ncbi:MAG TPA: hypothetical protein VNO79_02605 [Actinomycetota bacterium]|nr:hypothetical protein [Actinomycetota bacterium]
MAVVTVASVLSLALLVQAFYQRGGRTGGVAGRPMEALSFESGDDVFLLRAGSDDPVRLLDRDSFGSEGGLDLAWSPDGRMVAFTSYVRGDVPHVFVAAHDGSRTRAVSAGLWPGELAWSPDGTRIAFAGTTQGVTDIYVVGVDGSGLERLTTVTRNGVDAATMPAWSPDGTQIAFSWTQYDEATATEVQTIALVDASGGSAQPVTEGPLDESPAWSVRGQIAFLAKGSDGPTLKVVDPVTRAERTVATLGHNDGFAWSPVEDVLAFLDARTGSVLVATPGGEVHELTPGSAFGGGRPWGTPAWTPDGRWLAVAVRSGQGPSRIFILPATGGDPVPFSPPNIDAAAPRWQP